jgi:serine/threonine protein kinase
MTAKISDLGVARIFNKLTPLQVSRMTQTPGTPAFMPPEVMVANPKYDTSVDEFSYGIMMIHMFSGQWPEPQVGQIRTEPEGVMTPVSEAERREVFLRAVGNDHPLMDKILRCIDNDPQRRVHAPELLEHTSALKHEFPVAAVNYLEMQARVEALEGEKRTIEEEGNARVQNKEQQIARLGEEIQQKTEMIERQDLAHQNEIMQMQQQVEDANTQAELQKDLTEAKVAEVKSLSSQVETLSEEKKTSEQTLKTLRTDILTLQSSVSELSQQVGSLELENSTLKQNLSASDDSLKVKTLENEAVTKALKKKDVIISKKSEQLIKATEYIVSKKQVN